MSRKTFTFAAEFPFSGDYGAAPLKVEVPVIIPTVLGEERYGDWYCFRTELEWNTDKDKEVDEAARPLMYALAGFYKSGSQLFEGLSERQSNQSIRSQLGELRQFFGNGLLTEKISGRVWEAKLLWPFAVDFGELCYQTEPIAEININWRCRVLTERTNASPN